MNEYYDWVCFEGAKKGVERFNKHNEYLAAYWSRGRTFPKHISAS